MWARGGQIRNDNCKLDWLATVKQGGQPSLPKHHLKVHRLPPVGGLPGQQWVVSVQLVQNKPIQIVQKTRKVKKDVAMKSRNNYKRINKWVDSRGPPERKVRCESIHDSEGTFQNVKFRSFRRCNNRTNKLSMPLNKITKQIPPFLSIRYWTKDTKKCVKLFTLDWQH